MGQDSGVAGLGAIRSDLKYLNKEIARLTEKLDSVQESIVTLREFAAAQEERNNSSAAERDRIFKASTLLPVAVLTAVINIGINSLMRTSDPAPSQQAPATKAYIPTRSIDPKDHEASQVVDLK